MRFLLKTITFLIIIIFTFNNAKASYEPVKEVQPGLWVASKEVDGKTLYFAFQNKPDSINFFKHYAFNIGSGSNQASLAQAIKYIAAKCSSKSKEECLSSGELDIFAQFGLDSDEKKNAFLDYIYNSGKDMSKISSLMDGIPAGVDYFLPTTELMFAWVSTEPIEGYRDLGYLGSEKLGTKIDLDRAYKSNQDIVLLISASTKNNSSEKDQYIQVRGIFKPPHELLYGNHPGMSLMLHGFIAHAAKQLGKKVYYVNPASSMAKILNDAFVGGKAYRGVSVSYKDLYEDIDGKQPVPETKTISFNQNVFINIDSLEKFFTESN